MSECPKSDNQQSPLPAPCIVIMHFPDLTSVQYNYSHDLFCSTNSFSIFKPIAAQSNSAGSRLLSEIQLCYTSNGYCSMELLMPF